MSNFDFYCDNIWGKSPKIYRFWKWNVVYWWWKTRRWIAVKIYLDSYIVTGVWLHLLCLYCGGLLQGMYKTKRKRRYLFLSAVVCTFADGVSLLLLYVDSVVAIIFGSVIVLTEFFLGAWIAYGKKNRVKNGIRLFLITALFSGVFQLLPIKRVGIFCLFGMLLLPLLVKEVVGLFRIKQIRQFMYTGVLRYHRQEQSLNAFLDTGNRLRMYGSFLPVVLVDETYLAEWMMEAQQNYPQNLVFVPYKGVGGKGILHGIRLHCCLYTEGNSVVKGEVAAVAAEHKLFHGCEYQMILQPEVLEMDCVGIAQEGE